MTLFATDRFSARIASEADVPALQAFFEANPGYFVTVNGVPPRPDEARQEFDDEPPPHMPYANRSLLLIDAPDGTLLGIAHVLSDFLAAGVWHIGLFIVATRLHGSGIASEIYRALEAWMVASGAQWCRLGAVVGNARAERFWLRCGYVELRQRRGVQMAARVNDVRVMVKPLAGGPFDDYLARVPRDHPDSTLT